MPPTLNSASALGSCHRSATCDEETISQAKAAADKKLLRRTVTSIHSSERSGFQTTACNLARRRSAGRGSLRVSDVSPHHKMKEPNLRVSSNRAGWTYDWCPTQPSAPVEHRKLIGLRTASAKMGSVADVHHLPTTAEIEAWPDFTALVSRRCSAPICSATGRAGLTRGCRSVSPSRPTRSHSAGRLWTLELLRPGASDPLLS